MSNPSIIIFRHGELVVATTSVSAYFGRRNFQKFHDDAKYYDDPQFHVFKNSDDKWSIEHVSTAQNETVIDGKSIRGPIILETGMEIAVGNMVKRIIKFPLTVEITSADNTTRDLRDNSTHAPSKDIELSHSGDLKSSKHALRSEMSFLNWTKIRKSALNIARVSASLAAPIFLGLLSGRSRGDFGLGRGERTVIHSGNSLYGDIILTIYGGRVHEGDSIYSPVLMTIDGNKIRRGDSIYGDVLACVDEQSVKRGDSLFSPAIAMVDGDCVKEGTSIFGTTIARIERGGRMAGAAAAVYLLCM